MINDIDLLAELRTRCAMEDNWECVNRADEAYTELKALREHEDYERREEERYDHPRD